MSNLESKIIRNPPDPYSGSVLSSDKFLTYEKAPYGTTWYLLKVMLTFLASAQSSRAVCPQAALISDHSTGTWERRPSLKPFIVAK